MIQCIYGKNVLCICFLIITLPLLTAKGADEEPGGSLKQVVNDSTAQAGAGKLHEVVSEKDRAYTNYAKNIKLDAVVTGDYFGRNYYLNFSGVAQNQGSKTIKNLKISLSLVDPETNELIDADEEVFYENIIAEGRKSFIIRFQYVGEGQNKNSLLKQYKKYKVIAAVTDFEFVH